MIYLQLIYEFFKTGLFAIGGGLATLPFLSSIATRYDWFTEAQLLDMIAISESTPGPIGVNMSTYAGYCAAGIPGALVATTSLVAPSVIIIVLIAKFLSQFSENRYVKDAFTGLRPAVTGLIAAAGLWVFLSGVLDWDAFLLSGSPGDLVRPGALVLFGLLLVLTNKLKGHPVLYLAGAAVVGIVFKF